MGVWGRRRGPGLSGRAPSLRGQPLRACGRWRQDGRRGAVSRSRGRAGPWADRTPGWILVLPGSRRHGSGPCLCRLPWSWKRRDGNRCERRAVGAGSGQSVLPSDTRSAPEGWAAGGAGSHLRRLRAQHRLLAPRLPAPLRGLSRQRPAPPGPQPGGRPRTPVKEPFVSAAGASAGRWQLPRRPGRAGPGRQAGSLPCEPLLAESPQEDGDVLGCGGRGPAFLRCSVPSRAAPSPSESRKAPAGPGRGPGAQAASGADAPRAPGPLLGKGGSVCGHPVSQESTAHPRDLSPRPPSPIRLLCRPGGPGEAGTGAAGQEDHELASPCPSSGVWVCGRASEEKPHGHRG